MPPDSLVLNSNIVQGGTNAKPDNVCAIVLDCKMLNGKGTQKSKTERKSGFIYFLRK